MNNLRLTFTRAEWAELSGEQKLCIGLLRSWTKDLNQPTKELIERAEWWLTSGDAIIGPALCDEILELSEGVVAAHMRRKIEEAKSILI